MSYSGNMLINYGNGSVHTLIFIGKSLPLDNDLFWLEWAGQLCNVKHCADHSLYCNIQWCSTTNIRRCSTTNSGHLRLTVGKDLQYLGQATLHNTCNINLKQDPFLAFKMQLKHYTMHSYCITLPFPHKNIWACNKLTWTLFHTNN